MFFSLRLPSTLQSLVLFSSSLIYSVYTVNGAGVLNITFPANPPASAMMNVVSDNFLGVSFELASFDTLWGKTVDTIPDAIQNYLHNLNARTTNPLRIRVGGNAMDGSTYIANQTDTMLIYTDPNAYFNDIPVNFGPVLFDVMNAMYDKAAPMQFIIGLSMRDPEDDGNVVEVAKAAEAKLGDRLDAMLLGNEPDLYAGHGNRDAYNISAYIPEIGKVLDDLRSQNLLDNPIIGGPTVCCQWSLADIINAGLQYDSYKYYTLQHYPNNNCGGPNDKNTNITYYLSHMNLKDYMGFNEDGINLAKTANIPVLLTEYNSVSCGGSNISNTFAATLWAIDTGLKAVSSNFTAAYIHTREYGVTYNLFDPPTPDDTSTSTSSDWHTGSTYYSALFLSEAGSPSGSVVSDLNLNDSNNSPWASVAAYGLWDNAGTTRDKLVIINYGDNAGETQSFRIPEDITSGVLQYRLLSAPSVYETENITWAGQSVSGTGALLGEQEIRTMECTGGCTLDIPGPGAALVILSDKLSFYIGNSTIAGVGGLEDSNSDSSSNASMLSRSFSSLVCVFSVVVGVILLFI